MTLYSSLEGGKKIEIEAENSIYSSDGEVTVVLMRLVRTRNLGQRHETPDSDVSDSLQRGLEPKQRKLFPIKDEVSDDQLSSHF